jgi:matrixin
LNADGTLVKKACWFVAVIVLASVAGAQPLRLKTRHSVADARTSLDATQQNTRTPGRSHWLVQFAEGPSNDQLTALAGRGATVLSYVPDFAVSVAADDDTQWDGLDVQSVGRLQPSERISPDLTGAVRSRVKSTVVAEFYSDVDLNDARAIANQVGLMIEENPDLLPNHLLVSGTGSEVLALAGWDEVAYIFPAAANMQTSSLYGCPGAITSVGPVTQSVAIVGGWNGSEIGPADLKYSFVQMTEKLAANAAESEIVRAFSEWAKYAKLTFTPTSDATANQTIAVLFASGAHGDGYPFSGTTVLAHTFYPVPADPEPTAGDMHFNDAESWKIGADVDLFSIALHETGHALGLGHSDNPNAVMYPYYSMHSGLEQDDINAILQLYAAQGTPSSPVAPSPLPSPTAAPLLLVVQTPPGSTSATSIALNGALSGGAGAIQLNWSTNQGFTGSVQGSSSWSIPAIPLNVGSNVITITARDTQQNQATQTVTVSRQQASTPPSNPPTTPPSPTPPSSGPYTTPPSLTILSPPSTNVVTTSSTIVVSGVASDNVGVASVTWSSSTGGSGTASGTTIWTTPPIQLYIGSNTVIIHASDAAGNTSWRSLVVTRQ